MVVSREFGSSSAPLTCLGHPSHIVETGETICGICGHLVRGAVLGTYQVLGLLGAGRSGRAYQAMYVRRQQPVTLKLYPFDTASMHFWSVAQQEMEQVRQLNHPFILPVMSSSLWRPRANSSFSSASGLSSAMYRRELHGDESFMLILCQHARMTLSQFLEAIRNQATRAQAVSVVQLFIEQAGKALSAVHRQGVMHGSLVPGNFLLENQRHLWIADFGLARIHPPMSPYLAPELVPYVRKTERGDEWIQWEVVTPASDQYAFAVLCWQWLTLCMHINAAVMAVLQQAMQPNPNARFATIDEFVSNLLPQLQQHVLQTKPPQIGQRRDMARSFPAIAPPTSSTSRDVGSASQDRRNESAGPTSPMPASWMRRGDSYFAEHHYEEAIYAYKHALDENGRNASAWIALGDAHFALEQYVEALRAYEEAIRLNGNDATAWFNRGTVLEAMGRRAEADSCYARARLLNEG